MLKKPIGAFRADFRWKGRVGRKARKERGATQMIKPPPSRRAYRTLVLSTLSIPLRTLRTRSMASSIPDFNLHDHRQTLDDFAGGAVADPHRNRNRHPAGDGADRGTRAVCGGIAHH